MHDHATQYACRRRCCCRIRAALPRRRCPVVSVHAEPALPRPGRADPRSGLCKIPDLFQHASNRLRPGCAGPKGRPISPRAAICLFSDIPNNRIMKFDEKTGQTSVFRDNANYANGNAQGSPGPPRHLRAFGDPPHHPHREGRQDHGARRQVRGQAAERAERHRGEVRRQHLVHRSAVRHQRRMGRQEGEARAGHHQRLPHRQGRQDHRCPHRSRQSQRPRVLAGREEALRRRVERHAQPQHLELRRRRRRHAWAARPS